VRNVPVTAAAWLGVCAFPALASSSSASHTARLHLLRIRPTFARRRIRRIQVVHVDDLARNLLSLSLTCANIPTKFGT